MAKSSFSSQAIVALDSADADFDLASRQPCRLVFEKASDQASIFLEFSTSHDSKEYAITLAYDANILGPDQSLKRPGDTIRLPPEECAGITRNKGSGVIKHLTLTMIKEKCCKVLVHRSITEPRPELVTLYSQMVTLSKAAKIHVLFDYNQIHTQFRRPFMQFLKNPEKFSGYPADVSRKGKFMEVNPFNLCTVHDAGLFRVDTACQPDEVATVTATPQTPPPYTNAPQYSPTEKATTVATLGTPHGTDASNRQSEYTPGFEASPTEKATTTTTSSIPLSRINASMGHATKVPLSRKGRLPSRVDLDASPSPVPNYSPDTHAPIFQDIVANALESRLAEFKENVKNEIELRLTEVVHDVLPGVLRRTFEATSPRDPSLKRPGFYMKDSLRAILSEEAATQLEDKVDDIQQSFEAYMEDLSAALEAEWREEVEGMISSLQEETISSIREFTQGRISKIKEAGRRIREDAIEEFDEFKATLEHIEAVTRVRSNNLCNTCYTTPRKRVGDELASGSRKRLASVNHLQSEEAGKAAHALESSSAAQKSNHREVAMRCFVKNFAALDGELQLVIADAFDDESSAEKYVLLPPGVKKLWVQRQLKRHCNTLDDTGINFDKLIAEIEWNKAGNVTRKV